MISSRLASVLVLLGLSVSLAFGAERGGGWTYDGNLGFESEDGRFGIDITNLVQSRLTVENPETGDSGQSFDVSHMRVKLDGQAFGTWRFGIETDLATGSLSDDQNDSELLLDAWVKFVRKKIAQLWIGQGKVAFGRQSAKVTCEPIL